MPSTLFDAFVHKENFMEAWRKVRNKGAAGGVDNVSLEMFEKRLPQNLDRLRKQILKGEYIPQPVKAVSIPKFNEKRELRELGLPAVADKVVQAALLRVIEPLGEKIFHNTSYAYRKGKGHYKAICRVNHNLNNLGLKWVVSQDIDNFFDSLDHDRLLSVFSDLVGGDKRLVELAALWCRSGIVARDGKWRDVKSGVRQGQVIAPFLANLYLNDLDYFVDGHGYGWVRYADDYLIMCKSKEEAHEADNTVRLFLKESLNLHLNPNERPVANKETGFIFLGIYFKGDRREIARKKIDKMKRKLSWMLSHRKQSTPEDLFSKLEESIKGWKRYYGFLGQGEQFAEIETFLLERLEKLVAKKVFSGSWPRKMPAGLGFPGFTPGHEDPRLAEKRAGHIWKRGIACVKEIAREKADTKNRKQRRRYNREQLRKGEVFVITPGHFVGKRGNRIITRVKQRIVSEIPVSKLNMLTVSATGQGVSTDVISYCTEKEIPFHLIDPTGRIKAVLQRPDSQHMETVLKQVSLKDECQGLELARAFILGKVKNQISVIKSYNKYKLRKMAAFDSLFKQNREQMERLIKRIASQKIEKPAQAFRNKIMGLEGTFASKYWEMISAVIPEQYGFTGRKRKGARDLVNSLLNYGYGILYAEIWNGVIRAGLNPMAGFLHSIQKGKPALIFDMIEEFRAPVVDRAVFSMLNRRECLEQEGSGLLNKETRKKVVRAVTGRLGTEVVYRNSRCTLKEVIFKQAIAVKAHIYGKAKYRPYLSRW